MKILIKTLYASYELIYDSPISTNTVIEDIAKKEKTEISHIILLYNSIRIGYLINELMLDHDSVLFILES